MADSQAELLQVIANDEVAYPVDDGTHSPSLLQLLRGLLERAPRERMRVREMRRDVFITADGNEPLPPALTSNPGAVAVSKPELTSAIKRVALMQRADWEEAPAPAPALAPALTPALAPTIIDAEGELT